MSTGSWQFNAATDKTEVQVSNLQDMKGVLCERQLLQLAVSLLQVTYFLLQLIEQLLGPRLTFFLLLSELLHEPVVVVLDGGYEQGADLRTALHLSLCHFLSKVK